MYDVLCINDLCMQSIVQIATYVINSKMA